MLCNNLMINFLLIELSPKHFKELFKVGSRTLTDDILWNPAKTNAFSSVMWESPFLFCFTSHTGHGRTSLHVGLSSSDMRNNLLRLNKIKPWSPNVSMRHTPTCVCGFVELIIAWRILYLSPTRPLKYPAQRCWVEEFQWNKTTVCPLRLWQTF